MLTVAERFARIRRELPELNAERAIAYARFLRKRDELSAVVDVDYTDGVWSGNTPVMRITLPNGAKINVYYDDEPYDWGDYEPSEEDMRNLCVIGCALVYAGDTEESDSCWAISFFDHSSTVESEALGFAIEAGWIEQAETEAAERDRLAGFVETVEG